jgi:hypothetical protein
MIEDAVIFEVRDEWEVSGIFEYLVGAWLVDWLCYAVLCWCFD